jgi:aminomethyltransferase
MIAAQGPEAIGRASKVLGAPLETLKRFGGAEIPWQGVTALVTRTGYTGEDGVEIVVPSHAGMRLWEALLDAGATPCGLGARDTLRLEAGLPLHGNDISTETNPMEAGLERFVRTGGGYTGAEAIEEVRQTGPSRRLVGFKALERGVAPRHGHPIIHGEKAVGTVTSGSFSPTLGINIGMGYMPAAIAKDGTRLSVDVRGARVEVETVPLPFYTRQH